MIGRRMAILVAALAFAATGCTNAYHTSLPTQAASSFVAPSSSPVSTLGSPALPPLSTSMQWHHQCPAGFNFCADFPYLNAADFEHNRWSGATAVGMDDSFASNIYIGLSGGFCSSMGDPRCPSLSQRFYQVEVFTSKYTDPWKALTAINDGVKDPKRTSIQGNLACSFAKGIYGGPGLTIWHRGKVYYLETNLLWSQAYPESTQKFLDSIQLT